MTPPTPSGSSSRARQSQPPAAAGVLFTLGVVALSLAAVVSVARRGLFDREAFAQRLGASLQDPRVAAFVADRLTDAVLRENPDLTAFRPLIAGTVRGAVSTPSFQALVRASARTVHAALFSEAGQTVIVSVPDMGVLLKSALAKASPSLAEKVPARVQGVLTSIGSRRVDRVMLRVWRLSGRSQWLAGGLALGGILLVFGGFLRGGHPRHAIGRLGLRLMVAGVALFLLGPAGAAIAATLPHDEIARAAAAGVWSAFAEPLRTWALVLGGTGLVFRAASRSLTERFELRTAVSRSAAWIENPGGTRGHALRALLLVGAGTVALLWPARALQWLAILLGAALTFAGLRELFEILLGAAPEPEEGAALESRTGRSRTMLVLIPAVALAAGIAWIGWTRSAPVRPPSGACNGAAALCDRRVDEVVFPATHNSMSSADITDWMFPQQERGIAAQLEDGIRALLFDVHYGIPVEDRVKTDLDSEAGSREKLEKAVGKEGLAAAMRIRDRLAGKAEGSRGLYLCHGFCELGATPLQDALERVYEFLVQNPDEVLLLVVEDYVSPEDLASAFAASGLDSLVYRGAAQSPWPTLREMVDSRQRVLVLTESGRPGVPWLHPAFDVMQETPYHFEQPSELSCAPNRGGTAGTLFLMNNWIDTTPAPRPSNAAIVNAYDALLARARQCQASRNRQPTVLAVDFYRTGALFRVARTLNGLEAPAAP
jgi:hypothetical protein